MKIRMALESPDRQWRVEVVQQGPRVFYRLIGDGQVRDKLAIATVQWLLQEAGVSMADLVEAPLTGGVRQAG